MPLLTIAIPTFNRAVHLKRLLDALLPMTEGLGDRVELLVSDNASTDETPQVLTDAERVWPGLQVQRNATNIGGDGNIARSFQRARGTYVWIMGDDDIPKVGFLPVLLDLLEHDAPDLVYAPSEWLPEVLNARQGRPFDPKRRVTMNRTDFARYVNVWVTFISGMIVRRAHAAERADIASFDGSLLIQLSWVLPALKHGTHFVVFGDEPILATAANTGGYGAIKVFGATFPTVLAQELGVGSAEYRAMVGRTVSGYLPQLIWGVRTGTVGRFDNDFPWALLREKIGRFPAFWLIGLPVGRGPVLLARGALALARTLSAARRVIDRRVRHRL
jgi:abequosyltransferase